MICLRQTAPHSNDRPLPITVWNAVQMAPTLTAQEWAIYLDTWKL